MARGYTWQDSPGGETAYQRPTNHDRLGWWAAVAMCLSVLLHVVVFFALDKVRFALGMGPAPTKTIETRPVTITQPVQDMPPTASLPKDLPVPEEILAPPPPDAKVLEDIEILPNIVDQPVDITPQIDEEVFNLKVGSPAAAAGLPDIDPVASSPNRIFENSLEQLGRDDIQIKPAAPGQVVNIVDPGSMKNGDSDLSKFTNDILRKGIGGQVENGLMDGVTSLDGMLGLPVNKLIGAKAMLSSDLLFEFNKYDLKENARFGLMKLGTLLDANPKMYCWIEGHTDLIGGDEANLELSRRRAEAVKDFLVRSMGFNPDKIITRGYGRFQPLVTAGDRIQQAPNRRVEIKIRPAPPKDEQIRITPPKAAPVGESPPPPVAPPVRTVPKPRVPVEVVAGDPPKARQVSEPAMEPAPALRAIPIEPEDAPPVRRAIPVAPEVPEAPPAAVPRAEPVAE